MQRSRQNRAYGGSLPDWEVVKEAFLKVKANRIRPPLEEMRYLFNQHNLIHQPKMFDISCGSCVTRVYKFWEQQLQAKGMI